MSITDGGLAAAMLLWADQMEAESSTVGRLLAAEVRNRVTQHTENLAFYAVLHDIEGFTGKLEKSVDDLRPSLSHTQPYGRGYFDALRSVSDQLRGVLDRHLKN